jgi:hypothetical protein
MAKVYIFGAGDSGLNTLSFEGEVWGINNIMTLYPHIPFTRIFEVHAFTRIKDTWLRKGEKTFRNLSINTYIDQLNNSGVPIYILPHQECPFKNTVTIPIDALIREFRDFFSTTVSYELALAIREGFSEICLVGIDMILTSEYRDQRPSVTYFVGLAEGKGIKVTTSKGSPLVKNDYRYGLGISKFTLWDRRLTEMRRHMISEISKHQSLIDQYKGAQNCLVNIEEFFTSLLQGADHDS